MPSSAWMVTAVAGKVWSEVEVARMMRSMSSGASPASSSAARAAHAPIDEVNSPSAAIRRSLMPVRAAIHPSEVSTIAPGRHWSAPALAGIRRIPSPPSLRYSTSSPRMLRGPFELELRMERGNIACQALDDAVRRHVVGKIDGTRETGCIGSAVAFDGDAVQPEKYAAIEADAGPSCP